MDKDTKVKKENKVKKIFSRFIENMDKKMKEKADKNKCCCGGGKDSDSKGKACCG